MERLALGANHDALGWNLKRSAPNLPLLGRPFRVGVAGREQPKVDGQDGY